MSKLKLSKPRRDAESWKSRRCRKCLLSRTDLISSTIQEMGWSKKSDHKMSFQSGGEVFFGVGVKGG